MKPIERSEILELGEYELIRERFRARIIQMKRVRRVPLGSNMTVLFENRDTVLFQIQEMLRTERITTESSIRHEIDTYNQLCPRRNELSATVFIEYTNKDERDRMLVTLAGVEQAFYVKVAQSEVRGAGEVRGERTDRTTAVQYVKFPLPDAALADFGSGAVVCLGVRHPQYVTETVLTPETRAALAADFSEPN